MKKQLLLVCLVAALLGGLSAPASAGGRKKTAAPQYHETILQAVAPAAITVTQDGASKTVPVNQFTEFTVKGQRASAADLKPGMMVSVTLGADGVTASRINGEDAPVHPEPATGKKKNTRMPAWMR